ncbi:suppressor of forked protein (Suf) domain-containing protein [Sarocladium implicatum]|nr:suppressor of forked protein (Suf) domain-containing protein [Sarocladium implicatum]
MATEGNEWPEEGYENGGGASDQHSDEQVEEFDPESHHAGDARDDHSAEDDGADYDPESVTLGTPTQPPERQSSSSQPQRPAQTQKPKVSGGFVMEASDDEDEDGESTTAQKAPPRPSATPQAIENSNGVPPRPSTNPPPALAGLNPIAILEARVKEDPRGDMDAWLELMAEHRRNTRLEEVRSIYNRFLEVFPQSAEIWSEWIEMELSLDNFVDAEQLFGRCLMTVPNVKLWTVYLNYIRRRNDLTNDTSGNARRTITQSYEFVIDNIGVDRDSGDIWVDYIQFIKSGPGQIGGAGWQDQQKMDQLRKAYHRAIVVPMSTVNMLWKEYDQFEMGLNKATGRKLIQERSPGYMSAKSANMALDNITRHLSRTTLPRLPPAPGFDGDVEYRGQVEMWKKWLEWEKEDPLVLKDDEPKAYQQRIMYCYKQALMAMRFWPEFWVEVAEWCFETGIRENDQETGVEMLLQGISANPESVLLALKHADHIEATFPGKEGDKAEYAKAVRKPYDAVLTQLYAMGDKVKEREKLEISTLKQAAAMATPVQPSIENDEDEDGAPKKSAAEEQISAIQKAYVKETQLSWRTISYVWIALARAMRRIQGKGSPTEGGLREVFTDARKKGRLTSDVYVAVALLECVVYKDPVGHKIFERGARLFPTDENYMIEYLKYLHSKDDTTNARVVFETCVNKLVANQETLPKAKPLYQYFHKHESQYGELSQISKLEARMAELFPEDPKLKWFAARYETDTFDPVAAPVIISKAAQMRPKQLIPVVVEQPLPARHTPMPPSRQEQSPRVQYARATASPKRPLGAIDEDDINPPKRLQRGLSPLKGAAGRRLDQQRRNQTSALHRDITFLLGILPPAHSFDGARVNNSALVSVLRETHVPDQAQARSQPPSHGRQVSGDYAQRGASPFGRVASAGYRNSPLRTEAPAGYQGGGYGQDTSGQAGWPAAGGYGGYRY